MSASNRDELGKALWLALKSNTQESRKAALELLEAGADPNFLIKNVDENPNQDYPLHLAVRNNDVNMILQLLSHDANPALVNISPNTPITLAAINLYWSCVIAIAQFKPCKMTLLQRGTALYCALRTNTKESTAAAKVLLDAGVNPNVHYKIVGEGWCWTLHLAMRNGDDEIIRSLILQGANPAALNERNETPLNYAMTNKKWVSVAAYARAMKQSQKAARLAYITLQQGNAQDANLFSKLPIELLIMICKILCPEFNAIDVPAHAEYKRIIKEKADSARQKRLGDEQDKKAAVELVGKKADAFKKIYQALRTGRTIIFEDTDFLVGKENIASDELIKQIEAAVKTGGAKNDMIVQAWKSAQVHWQDYGLGNIPLFKEIYNWSFENSTFRLSRLTGSTLFSSKSVKKQIDSLTREQLDRARLNEDSRTGKICRILASEYRLV